MTCPKCGKSGKTSGQGGLRVCPKCVARAEARSMRFQRLAGIPGRFRGSVQSWWDYQNEMSAKRVAKLEKEIAEIEEDERGTQPQENREYGHSIGANPGYIYILRNPDNPRTHLKIGRTINHPEQRAKQLHSTGVARPFVVEWSARVADCVAAERQLHKALNRYRISQRREWFDLELEDAITKASQIANAVGMRGSDNSNSGGVAELLGNLCLLFVKAIYVVGVFTFQVLLACLAGFLGGLLTSPGRRKKWW